MLSTAAAPRLEVQGHIGRAQTGTDRENTAVERQRRAGNPARPGHRHPHGLARPRLPFAHARGPVTGAVDLGNSFDRDVPDRARIETPDFRPGHSVGRAERERIGFGEH